MVGKFFIAAAFTMAWIYTPEVYATSVRSVAMSYASLFARIASILATYVFILVSNLLLMEEMVINYKMHQYNYIPIRVRTKL